MQSPEAQLFPFWSSIIPFSQSMWIWASSESLERNLRIPFSWFGFHLFLWGGPKGKKEKKTKTRTAWKSQALPRCSSSHQTLGESMVGPTLLQSHPELSFQGVLPNARLDSPKPAGKEEAKWRGEGKKQRFGFFSVHNRIEGWDGEVLCKRSTKGCLIPSN